MLIPSKEQWGEVLYREFSFVELVLGMITRAFRIGYLRGPLFSGAGKWKKDLIN